MMLDISVLFIAFSFLLIDLFFIPFLFRLWRTAKKFETTTIIVNEHLPGILKNVNDLTSQVRDITSNVHSQVANISSLEEKITGVVDDIVEFEQNIRDTLQAPFSEIIVTISAVLKAVNAFLSVWRSKA